MEGNSDTLEDLSRAVHRIKTNDLPKDEYQEILRMIVTDAESLLAQSNE